MEPRAKIVEIPYRLLPPYFNSSNSVPLVEQGQWCTSISNGLPRCVVQLRRPCQIGIIKTRMLEESVIVWVAGTRSRAHAEEEKRKKKTRRDNSLAFVSRAAGNKHSFSRANNAVTRGEKLTRRGPNSNSSPSFYSLFASRRLPDPRSRAVVTSLCARESIYTDPM